MVRLHRPKLRHRKTANFDKSQKSGNIPSDMPKPLIIVESPAKARTISGILGKDYLVTSSVGHIRDLPGKAAEIPQGIRKEKWARLGVNVDKGFKPVYVVNANKKKTVKELKTLMKDASELFLATDEDREGEAIAWHLLEVLKPKIPVSRMVFHEVTPGAIQEAVNNPRDIDQQLVDAQEARRILDRLYGYEVSPVLWKKIKPRLSAGRVQSVAVRIIVQRERERLAFVSGSYWDLTATFTKGDEAFTSALATVEGKRVASGRDFNSDGTVNKDAVVVLDSDSSFELAKALEGQEYSVESVDRRPYSRKPYAPFRTSTLQQEAGRKLRFSSSRTMSAAQRLYENGYITYMRTDSTNLSETAVNAARDAITTEYGPEYVPDNPRVYASKAKGAQEAHEAIRPAGDAFKHPDEVSDNVQGDEARLYDLIWRRTVACQMKDARGESVKVTVAGRSSDDRDVTFTTSGRMIHFSGFLKAYVRAAKAGEDADDQESHLPAVDEGDVVVLAGIEPVGHDTKPPARYNEASLVQRLEELGVGRPSTYASIMSTIQNRGYVWKKANALVPSFTAFATTRLLEDHFPVLVDYEFTAKMEGDLDEIADGNLDTVPWLTEFYFGDDGLKEKVESRLEEIDPREINSIPIGDDEDGNPIVARVGRYGPYVQRGEDRASVPDDIPMDELTVEKAVQFIEAPADDRELGVDPDSGLSVYVKNGRFGPYVQLGELDVDSKDKPKRASLLKDMDHKALDFETAQKLLGLPRLLGENADGVEIHVNNGRYGPYLSSFKDNRTLESEDQIFSITLKEALAIYAEPKRRGGRRAPGPLKTFAEDPNSKKAVTLRDGRFGPYVSDGTTNASLRQGDNVETITEERAFELLAERRASM